MVRLSVWNFLFCFSALISLPASGDQQLNELIALKSSLQLKEKPVGTDEKLIEILFSKKIYPKDEFCEFLTVPLVASEALNAISDFQPRKVQWFQNLKSKIQPCFKPGDLQLNTWLRRLNFNILLSGAGARSDYTAAMKIEPEKALEFELNIARVYLAEGNAAKFEETIHDIINKKKTQSEVDVAKTQWAHFYLAEHKVSQGDFAAATKQLQLIGKPEKGKKHILEQEIRIVEFHKALAEYAANNSKAKPALPAFCDAGSAAGMRYRELEVCLVGDVLLNKTSKSKYLTDLEPLLPKLMPVQIPQVALTLMGLKNRGIQMQVNPDAMLKEIELKNMGQTMFKSIFDYSNKRIALKKGIVGDQDVIKALGRHSLYGLVGEPLPNLKKQ